MARTPPHIFWGCSGRPYRWFPFRCSSHPDPQAFLGLIELASGGADLTLVDDWGDVDYAPRRILATTLKQIAATQRDIARRAQRRRG